MKRIFPLFILLTFSIAGLCQGVFTNDVNLALQKVIQDYPNHFINIKGAPLTGSQQGFQFHSRVEVPGTLNCRVTLYNAEKKEMYGWTCVVLESGKFGDAKNKFTELYNQIRNTIVKIEGEKPFILTGNYETPTDEKKFTTIIFQLLPATGNMQKLKVELTLQHTINDWKLTLSVYDQERKSDEQLDLTDRY